MRKGIGTVCMVLGAVSLLAALLLFSYNRAEDNTAGKNAGIALSQVQEVIKNVPEEDEPQALMPNAQDMTVREVDGYGYIGCLAIPALDLELPVMSEWDYSRLKIAPCRYYGSTKTADLVIAAHNYTRHFGNLSLLEIGDLICFTDIDGEQSIYEVAKRETLAPTDVLAMIESDYSLSLYTCTYGGESRITIRCTRLK